MEACWVDKVFANDLNGESAGAYTLVSLRLGFEQKLGGRKLNEFARIDNILDQEHVGPAIASASNGSIIRARARDELHCGCVAKLSILKAIVVLAMMTQAGILRGTVHLPRRSGLTFSTLVAPAGDGSGRGFPGSKIDR